MLSQFLTPLGGLFSPPALAWALPPLPRPPHIAPRIPAEQHGVFHGCPVNVPAVPRLVLGNPWVAVAQQVANHQRAATAGDECSPDLALNPADAVFHICNSFVSRANRIGGVLWAATMPKPRAQSGLSECVAYIAKATAVWTLIGDARIEPVLYNLSLLLNVVFAPVLSNCVGVGIDAVKRGCTLVAQ